VVLLVVIPAHQAQIRKRQRDCGIGDVLRRQLHQVVNDLTRNDLTFCQAVLTQTMHAVGVQIPGALPGFGLVKSLSKLSHDLLRAKQKEPATKYRFVRYMAQALRRRLRRDIHDGLFVAPLAENCKVFGAGVWQQPKHLVLTAGRAHKPSSICLNFTTGRFNLQHF
jgi:hypothetical protein